MRYLKQYVVSLVAGLALAFSATTASAGTEVARNAALTAVLGARSTYGPRGPRLCRRVQHRSLASSAIYRDACLNALLENQARRADRTTPSSGS